MLNGNYYYFDCLDGMLSDRPLTVAEISRLETGKAEPMTVKQIRSLAANYEAELYRVYYADGREVRRIPLLMSDGLTLRSVKPEAPEPGTILPYDQDRYKYHIKCNIPGSAEDYTEGYGEGCFVLVDQETLEAYENDTTGGRFEAVLDNLPAIYDGLEPGTVITIEMRGEKRPVAVYDELIERYAIK